MKALPQQPEGELVRAAIGLLRAHGCAAWRNQSGVILLRSANGRSRAIQMGEKGLPDIVGVLPNGRMVVIECKRRGNALSDFQRYQLDELRARNALVIVAYDILDVQKALAIQEVPDAPDSHPQAGGASTSQGRPTQ